MKMTIDNGRFSQMRTKALTLCLLGVVLAVSACGGDTKIRKTNCWAPGTPVTAVTPSGRG